MSETRVIMTQQELDRRIDAIKVCGTNRGPHDYIPISWFSDAKTEKVDFLMCRVCLNRVSMKTIYDHFGEVKV